LSKICFFVPCYLFEYNRGGAELQAWLISQIIEEVHEVFFISLQPFKCQTLKNNHVRIYEITPPKFPRIGNIWFLAKNQIIQILKKENPDFIYQRVLYSGTGIAALYCMNTSCKLIWHVANNPDVEKIKLSFSRRYLLDLIEKKYSVYGIKNADRIVGQTNFQNHLLEKNYNRNCDLILPNLHYLPNDEIVKGVNVKIVWVANNKKAKQPDIFVWLADQFISMENIQFIMIGRPNPAYQIDSFNKLHPNLKILGDLPLNKVNEILATSHIFVNTSLYEGFPNTFIQAWMRKVPVISLHADIDNFLKDRQFGFLSNTKQQLVQDINLLIKNKEMRVDMGIKASKYAFNYYSIESRKSEILELFNF
jgi:glycosyltransferase involved in cell wall biosynthesis